MNLDSVKQSVINILNASPKDADVVIDTIVSYDGLFESLKKSSNFLLNEIKSSNDNTSLVYVPCYTIELRTILKNRTIHSTSGVAAFKYSFAKKYLNKYHALIVVDKNRLSSNNYLSLKGLTIFKNSLDLKDAIVKVYSLGRGDQGNSKIIENIVKENKDISFHVSTDIPGISVEKTANNLQKYIVNINILGIDDEVIKSDSDKSAVEEALKRRKHKNQVLNNDPKYTVEYWQKSGYWPYIVKKAIKTAQSNEIDIKLSTVEQKIFSLLLNVNQKYNLGLTFRVAGGWTRDRILGKESDDIDIAIDKMTGSEFGKYLAKEVGKQGNVIKANPEQSKHLETLTINLFGQDVDFVNLRSETYGDSRIPEMQFGTPEQDASRRDLTINSLFYNINSASIEDFTGKGIEDLKTLTLRTPLDAQKTFTDDPLRILRMLRFYSRYKGSTIDPSAIEAMKNPEVQEALKKKVSPERVYTEWNKLFVGNQQTKALRVLYETGIWDNVLKPEEMKGFHSFEMDQKNPHHVDNVLEHTLKVVEKYDEILRLDNAGDEERAKALSSAFLHDIGKLDPSIIGIKEHAEGIIQNTYHGHEDVSAKMSEIILKSLKASNEDIQYISTIVKNHMLPHNEMSDKQLRKLMRNFGKDLVKRIIQHAKADALSKPGSDGSHYNVLLDRLHTLEPSAPLGNPNAPPVDRRKIMALPEFQLISNPNYIKLGWLNEITEELQNLKDQDPSITEEQLLTYCVQNASRYIEKYTKMTPPPKVQQKKAQTWFETMKTLGERPNQISWICGTVYPEGELGVFDTGLTKYQLFLDKKRITIENYSAIFNKRICAKGMIDGIKFILQSWSEQSDPNKDFSLIQRESPKDASSFEVGMKVRHRKRGLSFAQIEGTVDKIKDNLMYIKWNGIPELEVFNLLDTVNLHLNLIKA